MVKKRWTLEQYLKFQKNGRFYKDYRYSDYELQNHSKFIPDGYPVSTFECMAWDLIPKGKRLEPYPQYEVIVSEKAKKGLIELAKSAALRKTELPGLLIGEIEDYRVYVDRVKGVPNLCAYLSTHGIVYRKNFFSLLSHETRKAFYEDGKIVGDVHVHPNKKVEPALSDAITTFLIGPGISMIIGYDLEKHRFNLSISYPKRMEITPPCYLREDSSLNAEYQSIEHNGEIDEEIFKSWKKTFVNDEKYLFRDDDGRLRLLLLKFRSRFDMMKATFSEDLSKFLFWLLPPVESLEGYI